MEARSMNDKEVECEDYEESEVEEDG